MPDSVEHRADMHRVAQERRRKGLHSWDRTVRIGSVLRNEEMTFEQRRDAVVAALRSSGWRSDGLGHLLEELSVADGEDGFNDVWDAVYDLADEERVWIERD